MTAGLATLSLVEEPGFFETLTERTGSLVDGIAASARRHGVHLAANRGGGMFGVFFTEAERVGRFSDVMACDTAAFGRFHARMLEEGIYLAPSAFEAGFVSIAHETEQISATVEAADRAFAAL
jgi:glutamate-1-semialdehyde 2,1-aminomutase